MQGFLLVPLLLLVIGGITAYVARRFQAGWRGWLMGFLGVLLALFLGFFAGSRLAEAVYIPPDEVPGVWESIPLPSNQQLDRFIIVDEQAPDAHVVTKEGRIYSHPCYVDLEHANWRVGKAGYNHHGSCDFSGQCWPGRGNFAEVTEAPGKIVQRLYCAGHSDGGNVCLYVILDSGEIWRWWKRIPGDFELMLKKYALMLQCGVVGAIVGGVSGSFLFVLLMWGAKRRMNRVRKGGGEP